MRVLLIEDDAALRDVMLHSLSNAGHRVDVAASIDEARHWWRVQTYDSVLLDLNLPIAPGRSDQVSQQGNGLSLLREARSRGDRTPVMVLTARSRLDERIAGLDAGADD